MSEIEIEIVSRMAFCLFPGWAQKCLRISHVKAERTRRAGRMGDAGLSGCRPLLRDMSGKEEIEEEEEGGGRTD